MPNLRYGLILPVLLLSRILPAQLPVSVVDHKAIVISGLGSNKNGAAALQAAGYDHELITTVVLNSMPFNWPAGWRTDSARTANQDALGHANAFQMCEFSVENEHFVVIEFPVRHNTHMPEHLRSSDPMYMVLAAHGVAQRVAEKPKPSKGPSWREMPKARINQPDQVYATYDLSCDPAALEMLESRGLSKPEIEAVIFRSHERNWPDGIDDFKKRFPKLKHFKKYNAFLAATWEDKVLIVIPAEENKTLPTDLRPYMDIYMVYTSPAVAVLKK